MPGTGSATTSRVGLAGRCRQLHLEHVAGADPVALADVGGVDADPAGGGEVGGAGAGEAEQPGDGGVDALALEAVGHEHGAGVSHRRARGGAPGPAREVPRKESTMMMPAPTTIAMSATLPMNRPK